ncbi:MAG: phage baseplate assembly protein V [Ottowia sp.]|nr:phage baseplate assembly protein V [Ottowia sp.]
MFFSPSTPSYQLTEIIRRLDNLLRIGTITHLDLSAARCRVKSGGLSTEVA